MGVEVSDKQVVRERMGFEPSQHDRVVKKVAVEIVHQGFAVGTDFGKRGGLLHHGQGMVELMGGGGDGEVLPPPLLALVAVGADEGSLLQLIYSAVQQAVIIVCAMEKGGH